MIDILLSKDNKNWTCILSNSDYYLKTSLIQEDSESLELLVELEKSVNNTKVRNTYTGFIPLSETSSQNNLNMISTTTVNNSKDLLDDDFGTAMFNINIRI